MGKKYWSKIKYFFYPWLDKWWLARVKSSYISPYHGRNPFPYFILGLKRRNQEKIMVNTPSISNGKRKWQSHKSLFVCNSLSTMRSTKLYCWSKLEFFWFKRDLEGWWLHQTKEGSLGCCNCGRGCNCECGRLHGIHHLWWSG